MGSDERSDDSNPFAAPAIQGEVVARAKAETKGIDLSVENPFLTIWTRPRATIRGILNKNPSLHVTSIAAIGGILDSLSRATQQYLGDRLSLPTILLIALAVGPVIGLIWLYVGAFPVGLTGRWLGGRAGPEEIRAAIAWSLVPVLATIPVWIIQLALVGREMFTSLTPVLDSKPLLNLLLMATAPLEIGLAIWSFVILLKAVGEAQRFSAGKALGSILLGILCVAVMIGVPILVLPALARR
jgi:hypothetical protein